MQQKRGMVLRLFAVAAALLLAFAGMVQSPAAAQITGTCQIVTGGDISADCQVVVDEANETCDFIVGEETFQDVDTCARILQGRCPFQMITETNTTIQIQCGGLEIASTATTEPPTATTEPPTATTVPPTATIPVETATTVPPTATIPVETTIPPEVTATVEPTVDSTVEPTVAPTESIDGDDDPDDAGGVGDDDEVVTALPSTGQGPDRNGGATMLLGAMSVLAAIGALAWRRHQAA